MKGFSTIAKNWYKNLGRADVNREIYIPKISDEEYYRLGKYNATQLVEGCIQRGFDLLDVVVDYGCGDGRVARYMSEKCVKIICADISEFVLHDAAKKLSEFNVSNAEYHLTSELKKENYADLIYTFQVIQHCNDAEQLEMVNHIKSMLKDTGIACIHMPKIEDKPFYHNNGMCMCFTKEQVEHFGKMFPSYEIEEIEFAPNWIDYYLWVRKTVS
jgi:2-polyprenyl-3-methyl-5-hydroxy-6-metoxy-1,4-benzoquinol methylase